MLWLKEFYLGDTLLKENDFLPISSMPYNWWHPFRKKNKVFHIMGRILREGARIYIFYMAFFLLYLSNCSQLSPLYLLYFRNIQHLKKQLKRRPIIRGSPKECTLTTLSFFIVWLAVLEKYCPWEDLSFSFTISKTPIVLEFYHSRAWSFSHSQEIFIET